MIPELGAAQPDPANILLSSALSFAGAQGYSFDPIATEWLRMFLSEAAERRIASSPIEQVSDLLKLVQDLQPLVFQFVTLAMHSSEQADASAKLVEPPHLEAARHRFCPLFPFC